MQKLSACLERLSERSIGVLLFVYALFIRFPFFFRDYIDRDESTFILMGQSWADGYLPYTQLWDIKPPLTFFFFGTVISIFGKSFIAIRLVGVLFVAVTAFFTYRITKMIATKQKALFAAFCCVVLQSLFGSLQGVMSEHIAMAFVTPAIWLLVGERKGSWHIFAIGLLMGIALMVKLNLAYVALFMGLALSYFCSKFMASTFIWYWNFIGVSFNFSTIFFSGAGPFVVAFRR